MMSKHICVPVVLVLAAGLVLTGCPQFGDPGFANPQGQATASESGLLSTVLQEIGILIGFRLQPVFGATPSGAPSTRTL